MILSEIIKNCGVLRTDGSDNLEIGIVTNDSRKVVARSQRMRQGRS